MKRKRLALLLAIAMTVTSLDSTAIVASGADFSSEVVEPEEISAQAEESQPTVDDDATVETSENEEDFSADVEVSEQDAEQQTDSDETVVEDAESSTEDADFGDGENVSEAPADAVGQAAPANATALEPGGTYTVSLYENASAVWFSYTPTETGEYVISSSHEDGNDIDPKVYLYQKDEDNELAWVSSDDDSMGNRDFNLRYMLKANTTYYYKATTYNENSTSGEYQVDFQKVPSVESIKISMKDGTDSTLIAGWDSYDKIENNIHMCIAYEDGNTWEKDVDGSVTDNYGNTYNPVWENASGETQYFNYDNPYLTEGMYSLRYRKSDGDLVESNYISVNAVSVENSGYYKGALVEGENNNLGMSENDIFSFTPSTSGKWRLSFEYYPYNGISVRYKNENGSYSLVESTNTIFALTAGTTYYLQFWPAYDDQSIEIKLLPEITSVNVDMTDVKTNFYADIENAYLTGCKIAVTYKNGEKGTVTFKNYDYEVTDSQGTVFRYEFVRTNEDGYQDTYGAGSRLPEGTYNLVFIANDEKLDAGEYTVTAEDPENMGIRELKIGVNKDVYSPEEIYTWYCFKPEKTGRYCFGPCSSFEIYFKDTVNNYMSYVNYEWAYNGRTCKLVEGTTYYIGLRGKIWDAGTYTDTFDLTITTCDVTDLAYSEKEITLLNGVNDLGKEAKIPVGNLTVKYGDSEETITPCLGGETVDKYGNSIHSKILDKDNKEYVFERKEEDYWNWKPLPTGTYTLFFVYEDTTEEEPTVIESAPVTLTVRNPEAEDFQELKIGERNKDVEYSYYDDMTGEYINSSWYLIRVAESGTYKLQTYKGNKAYNGYTNIDWQKLDENGAGKAEGMKQESDGCFYLPAGNYLVKLNAPEEYSSVTFDLDISRVKSTVSAKIVSIAPENPVYIARTEYAKLDELTVEVTYDDGTTGKYSINENRADSEGRELNYSIFRETEPDEGYSEKYTEVYNNYLYAGKKYFYRVFFGGTEVGEIPITVKSVEESVSADLNADGTTDVQNQQKLLLKYTAKETGRYEFAFNIPVDEVLIKTADDRCAEGIEKNGNNYFTDLEANTTYYLYVDANEDCEKLQVSVSMVTRPVKLAANALKKDYLAGVEGVDYGSIETTVDYSNQTSRTVRGNGSVSGYTVKYRVEKEDGERYWSGDTLTPGTWTVTPYLSAETSTGSSVEVDMSELQTETTTITAGLTDLSRFTALKESEWTDFLSTEGEDVYYSFTPEKNGKYTWETEDGRYGFNLEFYRQGEDRYESLGFDVVELNAGETYLVRIVTAYNKKGRIIPYEGAGSGVETVSDLELTEGMKKAVSVGDKYGNKWSHYIKATFTPEETAYYRLEALSWENKWVNTSAELYGEHDEWLASKDNGGQGVNFALNYQLQKGTTYTYYIYTATSNIGRETTPFVLSFDKIKNKKIKSVELVSVAGSDPASLYVLRDLRAFYNMEVTYADGEKKTYELEDTEDAYGNRLLTDIKTVEEVQEDFECEVVLRYGELSNDDTSKFTEYKTTVTVRGLNVIEKLEEGKEYTAQSDEYKEFTFTPSEDGEYIYTLKNRAEAYIYNLGKYVDGSLIQMNVSPSDGEEVRNPEVTSRSIHLKKGKTYLFDVYAVNGSFSIKKAAKKLNGLTLVSAPEQTTCLPGTVNTVSFSGLKVKASYTDDSTEELTYGTPDSCGRYIKTGDIQWLDGKRCRVYAKLGAYCVSFEVEAGSWDSIEEIKSDETKTLKGARNGDVTAVKFAPETSGRYQISVTGGNMLPEVTVSDSNEMYRGNTMYLQKGKTYYFYICATSTDPQVRISTGSYSWEERVDDVKKELDDISDEVNSGNISDETKEKVNNAVENITSIDNEELAKDANAMDTVKALEDTVLKTNADKVAETVTAVEDEVIGEVEVKGAALTAATVEAKEGQKLAAKVSVKAADAENAKKYEDLPENKGKSVMALNITLAVVDKANNDAVVGEAAIQPKAPIQMTVNVPAQYQGRDLKLYHIKDDRQEALTYTLNADGTKLTFVITALSDFTMVAGKCAEGQHNYGEGKVITPATCVNKGTREYTCSKCGDVKTEEIPATGEHDYSVKVSTVESTCVTPGYISWKCANCDATTTETLKLAEHQWEEAGVVTAATCAKDGVFRYQCKVCQKTRDEAIKATGKHAMGSWKVTSEPTAVAEGIQERSCTVCGKKESAKIAKLNPTVKLNVTIGKTLPLKVKQSFQVKASGLAKGDKVVSWKSSSTKIATVSKTGKIAGKKAGTATITVKLASGKSVWFKVKVQKSTVATTSLKVVNKATGKTLKSATLKAKKKLTLVTTIAPVTSQQKVTYSSSNKKVATVSSKGVITAKKKGKATITIKSGKKSVKIKITVK